MHVKFATLHDKHALGTWICSMEPWHGLKSICMDEGVKGLGEQHGRLGESHGRIGESYEDGHEHDGLDEQLGESDEDCIGLGGQHGDSASLQVMQGTFSK